MCDNILACSKLAIKQMPNDIPGWISGGIPPNNKILMPTPDLLASEDCLLFINNIDD